MISGPAKKWIGRIYLVCPEPLFRRSESLIGVLEPYLGLVSQLCDLEKPPICRVGLGTVFDQLVLSRVREVKASDFSRTNVHVIALAIT